jgi:hypothetical protein
VRLTYVAISHRDDEAMEAPARRLKPLVERAIDARRGQGIAQVA